MNDRPDPIERLLLDQAEAIGRLRSDLDELASEFTDAVTGVFDRLNDEREAWSGVQARPWSWRDVGPQAVDELWQQLSAWVAWIRGRYPLATRIPACWAAHPEIVEELTALWLAWQQAYQSAEPPLTGPSEWHDRWLPGVLHRLEHGPFALDCATGHKARPPHLYAESEGSGLVTPTAAVTHST